MRAGNNKIKHYAYTIINGGATIKTDQCRYTRWGEDAEGENEELYDHNNDPEEHVNLVEETSKNGDLLQLRVQFEEARKKVPNGVVLGN